MVGLGIGIFFAGYTLLAYGWSQIHGQNATLRQIAWPGAFVNVAAPDGGTPLKDPSTLNPNAGGNHTAGPGAFGPGSPNSPSTGGPLV